MSDILCKWLNEDVQVSQAIEPKSLDQNFSNGYLFGEVLFKYQLQKDFMMFTNEDTSVSKLNNFSRLEPTLNLLGIPFDTNIAQPIMQEKPGVARHLLYQLYISLGKKGKAHIRGNLPTNVGSHKEERDVCSDLYPETMCDAEQKLKKISKHHEEKRQVLNIRSVLIPPITNPLQQKRQQKVHNILETKNMEKSSAVQVPKPPPYTSQHNPKRRQHLHPHKAQQAEIVQKEIAQFETNRKKLVTYISTSSSSQPSPRAFHLGTSHQDLDVSGKGMKVILQSNDKYIRDIKKRLDENTEAREQRQKRLQRFMMEQMKAREAQERARRDEQLVRRLTRQTQQEQRLAAQLLQIRHQKEVILENRLFREEQFRQRRERDFQEALEREAALAQQSKLERAEEIKKEIEMCKKIAAERAQNRYKKHFVICKDTVEQMVDFATKVGEYRQLTGNLIPEKQMREWKELLLKGLPLYQSNNVQKPGFEFCTPLDPVEQKKQDILSNLDYEEYTNMVGEWAWPDDAGDPPLPLNNNNILGHILSRLKNISHQPTKAHSSPPATPFKLKACVLGKFCSGKTTCLDKISKAHGIYVLSADTLIEEALNAYQCGEVTEQKNEDDEPLPSSPRPDVEITDSNTAQLSTHAQQGAAVQEELKKGSTISTELLVDIVVYAIRQVPAQSCWILDGFPADIAQAHLLEKALGGTIKEPEENTTISLVSDPNPSNPPPPPAPVLDLVVLLDIPDECVVQRAFNLIDGAASSSVPDDRTSYLAQIQHRIRAFQETWPKLEKWFDKKQNILVRIDADSDEENLYKRLESVLQHTMMQTSEEQESDLKGAEVDQQHAEDAPGSTESHTHKNEQKTEGTNDNCEDVPESQHEAGTASPPLSCWEYVDDPLPPDIPEKLCSYWETMCCSYVNNIKTVVQQLRSQHTIINHNLNNIREGYQQYLRRPDLKQESVSQWQKDFNSIPDDMREDEETKMELHLRLDELCERLWDITDKRKVEDEKERGALMGEGFLHDHAAALANHHTVLMQVELHRFQIAMYVLKVYYLSMSNQVLPELPSKCAQIPLLDSIKERYEIQHQSKRCLEKSEVSNKDQLPCEKLISDYEEALEAIRNLVSNIVQMGDTEEQSEKDLPPADDKGKHSQNQKTKNKKGTPSKQKAESTPSLDVKGLETGNVIELETKVYKEYAAAQDHEENAAKGRLALVKAHGLQTVKSLQSRVEETFSCMQKWLEERYLAEMKSIDHLTKVTRHHIEAASRLQLELVLEGTNFYLTEHQQKVQSPPPRPPSMEKSSGFTLTVSQLESIYQKLYTVAPLGLIPSSEFFKFLWNMMSISMDGCSLPEPWFKISESQLLEIVGLLTDEYELLDWRRFLLCAALPWPVPSISQLLVGLQQFRSIDTEQTCYVNEAQYHQAELWFSSESIQPVPEDPSEPLPYDRLTHLRKFFFRLFADQSWSPPQLDYVSMLQYLAAHPNPRQGFVRALSVVLGQHIQYASQSPLVKSMPSIDEATEFCSLELDQHKSEAAVPCESSSSLGDPQVSIAALLAVTCHKVTKIQEELSLPSDYPSQEEYSQNLLHVFRELHYEPEDSVPFSVLSQHPFIQSLMENVTQHQLVNIPHVLLSYGDDGKASTSTFSVNTGL